MSGDPTRSDDELAGSLATRDREVGEVDGLDQEPAEQSTSLRRFTRDDLPLLLGTPALCLLALGAWGWWRTSADLDDVELRILAWKSVLKAAREHLELTAVASVAVVLVAIPLGILLTRAGTRRAAPVVVALANVGQAAPVIGIIVLSAMWLGFGFWTAILALWLYALLPVLRNTIVGLQQVDPTLVEAARGMGMSPAGVLLRVELPIAVPVMLSGVRTALVLVVGTAAFGTFINAGGLGSLITTGITLQRDSVLVSGAVIIAVVALMVDWLGRVFELLATPRGLVR